MTGQAHDLAEVATPELRADWQAAVDACNAYDAHDSYGCKVPEGAEIFTGASSFAFGQRRGGTLVLAFRGSDDRDDWRLNLRAKMAWFHRGAEDASLSAKKGSLGGVHPGFLEGWQAIGAATSRWLEAQCRDNPPEELLLTGHSLGAALATLQGAQLEPGLLPRVRLVTFGSPRVGSRAFVRRALGAVASHRRYAHRTDPVCDVPPRPFPFYGYAHHGDCCWLGSGPDHRGPPADAFHSHDKKAYVQLLRDALEERGETLPLACTAPPPVA